MPGSKLTGFGTYQLAVFFLGKNSFQVFLFIRPVCRVPARGKRYTLRIFLLPVGLRVVIQEFKMSVQFFCSIIEVWLGEWRGG